VLEVAAAVIQEPGCRQAGADEQREESPGVQPAADEGEQAFRKSGKQGEDPSAGRGLPHRVRDRRASAFDEPDLSGAGAFAGLFRGEFHALAFPQELEHGPAN
jgi:hypothetical protein